MDERRFPDVDHTAVGFSLAVVVVVVAVLFFLSVRRLRTMDVP